MVGNMTARVTLNKLQRLASKNISVIAEPDTKSQIQTFRVKRQQECHMKYAFLKQPSMEEEAFAQCFTDMRVIN